LTDASAHTRADEATHTVTDRASDTAAGAAAALDALRAIVGASHVLTGEDAAPYLTDWRGRYVGQALAVVRPADTPQVAAVMKWCQQHRVPVVPQGGNTGLCGGATPDAGGDAIVLSLRRMDAVRAIDPLNDTITVEAGCVLQAVQAAARDAGRLFPLSLAAEGSCCIGGNLATNAGGTQVLRYGNTRDLALGLEVVTAQGEIWNGLSGLRKDNTGYDLRDIFIGSEGTLGVITAATLKLFPLPVASCTAFLAFESLGAALAVLARARAGFGAALTGFEVMSRHCLQGVLRQFPDQRLPLSGDSTQSPWFALLELSDSESEAHAQARFESILGDALEAGEAVDVAVAANGAQSRAMWHLRESIPLAELAYGKAIKHDISVPISRIGDFVTTTSAAIQAAHPGVQHVIFGHLGDGNLHYNVSRAPDHTEAQLLALQDAVYAIVHASVVAHGGSISAEHGIGQLKRDQLPRYKDPVALLLMRRIKDALDPSGIMNPGKVLQA
jgi:FAD/FMN-containing dehydrogenase